MKRLHTLILFSLFHHWPLVKWTRVSGETRKIRFMYVGFPGGAVVEDLPANAGDTGSSPGLRRSHMPRSN